MMLIIISLFVYLVMSYYGNSTDKTEKLKGFKYKNIILFIIILTIFFVAMYFVHESPIAWIVRGDALANSGNYKEAINAYDKAIELDPQNPEPGIIKELHFPI